jgi:hypothetical protein
MTRWWLLVLPLLAGCSVSTIEDAASTHTRNECSEDAQCGTGICRDGTCFATEGEFSSVLFEVTPPASVSRIGGVPYLKRIDGLSLSGGTQDIALARLAHLEGTITPNWANRDLCALYKPTFDEADWSVIVTPSDQLLGLAARSYGADVTLVEDSFKFSLYAPAGDYDVYLQAKVQPAGCQLTPQLYRRITVPEGKETVGLPLNLPAPSLLELRVARPASGASIDFWRVDMIDPDTKKPLSNEVKLENFDGEAYKVALFYSPVISPVIGSMEPPGRELVRIRAPEGVPAPTILLERSGLEVFPGEAAIDQLTSLPQIVRCEGQVVLKDAPEHVGRAVVTISAVKLNQAAGVKPGITTEYTQTVTATAEGNVEVDLFPGQYQVVAVPPAGSGYATGSTTWHIGDAAIQRGKTVEVTRLVTLSGSVVTMGGVPVSGATVSAVASPATLVVEPLAESDPVAPRPGSAEVDRNGVFVFGADPGKYDLSVRPAADTRFAWFVRPNVDVSSSDLGIDLGPLQMPLPLAYSGAVTAGVDGMTQAIPGALIRAYVYVTSQQTYTRDAGQADSVLQIGETRAGDDGRFELFLPAEFDPPAPAP